jgi:hypothetical protein
LVILEVLLLLATLLLFIITDSRTIRYIADSTADITRISYANIEGNLFNGLEITDLRYLNKPLFSSATIHWNPLTLFYDKVTITKVDAQGIELDTILNMFNSFRGSDENGSGFDMDYSFAINSSHFDVNPFVYEGVKFSSVVLESGEISLDKALNINTKNLYFKFDSDIVNLALRGEIEESVVLIETLKLESIASKEIIKLSHRLHQTSAIEDESNETRSSVMPIKEIRAEHIVGTLKPVKYGNVEIQNAELNLYDVTVDPENNFLYQAQKLDFVGATNFGDLKYQGSINDANIHAKGSIELDKELFNHYRIALNHTAFKTLPSELHLNHEGIWIDVNEHRVKDLLEIESDFNINLSKATHTIHYDYESEVFSTKSRLEGSMNYADSFSIENDLVVENEEVSYEGKIAFTQTKALPDVLCNYLIRDLKGTFKGTDAKLNMMLENQLLNVEVKLFDGYESLEVFANSKRADILLREFVPNLPEQLHNHLFALKGEAKIDMDDFAQSNVKMRANSNMVDVEAQMQMKMPYRIDFTTKLKEMSELEASFENVQFRNLEILMGNVVFEDNLYKLDLKNENFKLVLNYDSDTKSIEKGSLDFGSQSLTFANQSNDTLALETSTVNLQSYFQELNRYYNIQLPNLQGDAKVQVKQLQENQYEITIQSSHLKYLSDDGVKLSVTNLYDVNLNLILSNFSEIEIVNYAFKMDDNEYLSSFFANKKSFLTLVGDDVNIKKLWINDEVVVDGKYNIEHLEGVLHLQANSYKFRNKDFDLVSNVGLTLKLNETKIDVDGEIDLLGNAIYYEMMGAGIVEDSDIIILEEILEKEDSALKNLKLYLKIKSTKPLIYRSEDVEVAFVSDISVLKNYAQDMMVTGQSTITKGTYQFEDKRFVINKSHLYFTGDVQNPLLDIKASYSKDEYNVHVFISGTTDAPIVNFNSEPFLTQQQIMSLILFDGTGASTGTGAEAYTILGGTFAKGLIKSLGIDVDHLLLGQNEEQQLSLEVGKKISDDISVLYLRKDGLDGVKVRLEHSKRFETDIIIQPPNTSSIEFLYKRDR